ncbi:MAG: hydantoinase/oxoprolinase family protein [Bacillota bacterium]|nr:hydantoinase/oxoprolinase family protein [Bacillota bacterium]
MNDPMKKEIQNRKVRIGIDVGGTFTDAVVVDNSTYEIIAKEKVPTTHHAEHGVAEGIVQAIDQVLTKNNISPDDVIFIAHGTTQATNALLEGDVARVGIIGMGTGLEAERSKGETRVGNIELAPGKYLCTEHCFLDSRELTDERIREAVNELKEKGCEVIVASESYSVDNPENEMRVIRIAGECGMLATGGYEISQLYGLKARTRTAVVNAALIPKMMETADMTEEAVKNSGIRKPLMIMRCDGGVMSIDEVRKRPILTMLSGLAAGVAGALMYEKITDGVFLEAGGTSTDISAIRDGKVMIKNATVGGHKLYLTSLDVRTVGIAGGSMIVVENGALTDVGPRSAHIADLEYEVFADPEDMKDPKIVLIAPRPDDEAKYAAVECSNGKRYSLTLAGAANILGLVPEQDYAKGNAVAAEKAWQALADLTGMSVTDLCTKALDIGVSKVNEIVQALVKDYDLNPNLIYLVGGGGSASVITPYLSRKSGIRFRIAENAPYISTIGVSLAMVREQIERNVANPTEDDIRKIRHDVLEVITRAGADPATVEISIDVDSQKNILRATATGATELRTKDRGTKTITEEERIKILADGLQTDAANIEKLGEEGRWHAYEACLEKKSFFGLFRSKKRVVRVMDEEGVIRLQKDRAAAMIFDKKGLKQGFSEFLDSMTQYSDAGAVLPKTYLFFGQKMSDLSGVQTKDQLMNLADMDLEFVSDSQKIIAVCAKD